MSAPTRGSRAPCGALSGIRCRLHSPQPRLLPAFTPARRPCAAFARPLQPALPSGARSTRQSPLCAAHSAPANRDADFDDLVLDDGYYREIGITREEAEEQRQASASDIDPEGFDFGLDGLSGLSDQVPEHLRGLLEGTEETYGPQAMVMAGFRAEEYAMVRSLGFFIRLLRCSWLVCVVRSMFWRAPRT